MFLIATYLSSIRNYFSKTLNSISKTNFIQFINWYLFLWFELNLKIEIPGDSTAENLKILLQAQPGLGLVNVVRTRDCYGYTYTINWLSGGNKPNLTVSYFNFSRFDHLN